MTSHSPCDGCSTREDELARARAEAYRARELVATHGKVHELIAAGAPLEDVLVELIKGVEYQDPSVLGCVVLLDRESSTLHPGEMMADAMRNIRGYVSRFSSRTDVTLASYP